MSTTKRFRLASVGHRVRISSITHRYQGSSSRAEFHVIPGV
jgi:hypothetical protein